MDDRRGLDDGHPEGDLTMGSKTVEREKGYDESYDQACLEDIDYNYGPLSTREFQRYIKVLDEAFPMGGLSREQTLGLQGEVKAVVKLDKLRRMFPHPFPRPRVDYTPNFSSNEPDITVTIGSIVIPIEVKNWQYNGPITSYQIKDKVTVKNWHGSQHKLLLFIYAKALTAAAERTIKQSGLTLIAGIEHLLEAISSIANAGGSFLLNVSSRLCCRCGGVGAAFVYGLNGVWDFASVLCAGHVDDAVHGRGSVTVVLFPERGFKA